MSFRNSIVAGFELIRDAIQSRNFQSGTQGWRIARDGTAEFQDASIRGDIIAGTPGGARIEIDSSTSTIRVYDGSNTLVADITPSTGITTYHPTDGSRLRLLTLLGQTVLSLLPKSDDPHTMVAARIGTLLISENNADVRPSMVIVGPRIDAGLSPSIALDGDSADGTIGSYIEASADRIRLSATEEIELGGNVLLDGGSDLTVQGSGVLTVSGDLIVGSENGVNGTAMTAGTNDTTSATYADMGGTGAVTSFQFVKRYADTRIRIFLSASFYVTAAPASNAMFGVRINGTDYDIVRGVGQVNERQINSAIGYISSIPAGTYTVQGRWKRESGTTTCRRDTADWVSISAKEVD